MFTIDQVEQINMFKYLYQILGYESSSQGWNIETEMFSQNCIAFFPYVSTRSRNLEGLLGLNTGR